MNMQSQMSEQELITDLLNQEKQMISTYSMGITESSCQNLRHVLTTQMNQTCEDQYAVFSCMQNKGYYQTKDAQDSDVQQAKQKFEQMKQQLK